MSPVECEQCATESFDELVELGKFDTGSLLVVVNASDELMDAGLGITITLPADFHCIRAADRDRVTGGDYRSS